MTQRPLVGTVQSRYCAVQYRTPVGAVQFSSSVNRVHINSVRVHWNSLLRGVQNSSVLSAAEYSTVYSSIRCLSTTQRCCTDEIKDDHLKSLIRKH